MWTRETILEGKERNEMKKRFRHRKGQVEVEACQPKESMWVLIETYDTKEAALLDHPTARERGEDGWRK